MGDRLSAIYMDRKLGVVSHFCGGELGPHLAQCGLGRSLPPCQVHLDPSSPLATIDIGRKLGGNAPFWGGELRPYLTQCRLCSISEQSTNIRVCSVAWFYRKQISYLNYIRLRLCQS